MDEGPPVRRRPRTGPYMLPALAAFLWLSAEALLVAIGRPAPCPFRLLTGYPCPTCGSTRATLRLLHFDLWGALGFNPLVTVALLATPLALGLHLWLRSRGGSGLAPIFSRRPGLTTAVLVAALLVNWAYVLWTLAR